jgi:outer membrane receptor protein involved in Fe transport
MRPATTIDAFVGWPLTNRLQLIARAENLLDETVVATLGSDGTIERATPRTLWIGFRLTGF